MVTGMRASPSPRKLPVAVLWLSLLGWLGGCAVAPSVGRDGPPAQVPSGLEQVPDAEPRDEAFRSGGPNKPYEVLGRRYVPFTHEAPFVERGLASWYGRKFHGRRTALGEVYDMYAMTAAHPTLPLPSYARVRNPANGREVVVRVNDRGPFHPGRIVDLSYAAALRLDLLRGVAPVELERITPEAIRSGSWRTASQRTARPAAPNADEAAEPASSAAAATATAAPTLATIAFEASPQSDAQAVPPDAALNGPWPVPIAEQARGYWLQLGAFRQRDGAENFQRRVAAEYDWLGQRLVVFSDEPLYRLQAGPFANRDDALGAAERIRSALQLVPVVMERP
jgi:rare lipoprotein A